MKMKYSVDNLSKTKVFFLIVIVTSLFCVSCLSSFFSDDEADFEYYELDNEIPVILFKNESSKVVSLSISVEGGSSLLGVEQAGLEKALFEMMASGSKDYIYQQINETMYRTQASIYASSNQMGSVLGLQSIDYHFDELLPMLIDGFLNPVFEITEYTTLMTSFMQNIQFTAQDPNSLLSETIRNMRYENHPFETQTNATSDSINNITIDAMKLYLSQMHNASRIKIVAVGNFDGIELVQKLNPLLGKIERFDFQTKHIQPASIGGSPVVLGVEGAKGTGYVAYTVPAPRPGTKDEIAMRLASDIYSEILFNLVREHYGATYSIGVSYVNSKAPYAVVRAYMVSDLENISAYILEAENLMKKNQIISGKESETTEFAYSTIEERLEGYKNTLINTQFLSSQTNVGISSKILSSLFLYDNAEEHLHFINRVQETSAQDIKDAFNTYFLSNKQWFAVTGLGEEGRFITP